MAKPSLPAGRGKDATSWFSKDWRLLIVRVVFHAVVQTFREMHTRFLFLCAPKDAAAWPRNVVTTAFSFTA